jgi:hypothetical protein
MLKFHDCGNCLTTHVFDGVLIAEPIRSFDGVVHVPLPAILSKIGKACRNASLGGHGMTPGRKYLCKACRLQPGLDSALSGAQAGATGANDNQVIGMIDKLICA